MPEEGAHFSTTRDSIIVAAAVRGLCARSSIMPGGADRAWGDFLDYGGFAYPPEAGVYYLGLGGLFASTLSVEHGKGNAWGDTL
jgi:hypothetical protein